MPKMNGIQVIEKLRYYLERQNKTLKNVRIAEPRYVFLTAFLTNQFKLHIENLNVEQMHEKPLHIDTLREILLLDPPENDRDADDES